MRLDCWDYGRRSGDERAEKLGARSARRGAAWAILESAWDFAQLLRAAHWHSSAYVLFLDLGAEKAAVTARVPIEAPDDERPRNEGPSEGAAS